MRKTLLDRVINLSGLWLYCGCRKKLLIKEKMHLSDIFSGWESVKCCEFSLTAARCVFKLGALREVPHKGTSGKKWMIDDFPSTDMKRGWSER